MGDLAVLTGIIGGLVLFAILIILPICVYYAQKWAYECYKELRKINESINREK